MSSARVPSPCVCTQSHGHLSGLARGAFSTILCSMGPLTPGPRCLPVTMGRTQWPACWRSGGRDLQRNQPSTTSPTAITPQLTLLLSRAQRRNKSDANDSLPAGGPGEAGQSHNANALPSVTQFEVLALPRQVVSSVTVCRLEVKMQTQRRPSLARAAQRG